MKRHRELIGERLSEIRERMAEDLVSRRAQNPELLVLDVREPDELAATHIPGAINVPRGLLESACDWDYEETVPELLRARSRERVVLCRPGERSGLAAHSPIVPGFTRVASPKTGPRGRKDYEQRLVDARAELVDPDAADLCFTPRIQTEQRRPKGWRE